ncbi:MAG TPA: Fur family transcriptional regulator [Actinomycetota bacterium]|nr:Fur family transcriptional regulator [Actinomycetota bacterium]
MTSTRSEDVMEQLRARGHRMTPQRRAIVEEIMHTKGHISPQAVAQRVKDRIPGVNPSTIYRTLDLLEELGVLSHSHLEKGPEYHRAFEHDHVHLICSRCHRAQSLSEEETQPLKDLVAKHSGFVADFTHFAISGLCADCLAEED